MNPIYSVVLKSGIPETDREFLKIYAELLNVLPSEGEALLHFRCTRIDVSHHNYIEMETFRPGDSRTSLLRVPHFFVLAIDGDQDHPHIGFGEPHA